MQHFAAPAQLLEGGVMGERYFVAVCHLGEDGDELLTEVITVDGFDLDETVRRLEAAGASSVDVWELEPEQGRLFG